jgi:hypothetical protein
VSPGARSNIAILLPDKGPIALVPEWLPVIVAEVLKAAPPAVSSLYVTILVPAATSAGSIVTVKSNIWVPLPKPEPVAELVIKAIEVSGPETAKSTS